MQTGVKGLNFNSTYGGYGLFLVPQKALSRLAPYVIDYNIPQFNLSSKQPAVVFSSSAKLI
jgi:hypothetical protein